MTRRALPDRPFQGEVILRRFEVHEELGAGAFGRVLRCLDRETGSEVALKQLHRFGADALLRFKKEFRTLADVQHPNLVRLGELFEAEGGWAFSLEYVPGTDFLSWVRPGTGHEYDERRLRRALAGLVQGLVALHGLGLLHRDVKPHNVRVTPEGRVVLLDFGLVTHLTRGKQTSDVSSVGTAAYMAPEQANHERVGPAADFYALGVLLYESLTGCLPFEGGALELLLRKQREAPLAPSLRAPNVAADLEALCLAMLAPKPSERLSGTALLARLEQTPGALRVPAPSPLAGEFFVGRGEELASLLASYRSALDGGLCLSLIEGEGGIGKSALMQHFVEHLRECHPEVLVLSGRCHAAEQVSYKAFDGAIDELSRVLRTRSDADCRAVLPQDAHLLPVLFPVLACVNALRKSPAKKAAEQLERFPLFQAFAELLQRLGEERPVVFAIDDLQWSDEESLVLLRSLLDGTRRPRVWIVATVRPVQGLEDAVSDRIKQLFLREDVTRIVLSGLSVLDAMTLTASLTQRDGEDPVVAQLVREAKGHPFFLAELSRATTSTADAQPHAGTLDEVIQQRVAKLGEQERSVLETVCLEGSPITHAVLERVVQLDPGELAAALGLLRNERLLRPVRRGELASYHDRIREAVVADMAEPARASRHRKLAEAWQTQHQVDAARVAKHWLACGERALAAPWLRRAAEDADREAAFERAAEHYRALLDITAQELDAAARGALELRYADALANAGHCAESARVLLECHDLAPEEARGELLVRAAQRLLQAGEVKEGIDVARRALESLGVAWPRTPTYALVGMLWNRFVLAHTNKDSAARLASARDESSRELETLWRLAQPLAWAELVRSTEISSRYVRRALSLGYVRHVAIGLCAEAVVTKISDPSSPRAQELMHAATPWVERTSAPEVHAYAAWARGASALFAGDWRTAERELADAERRYREDCPAESWLLANARATLLASWFWRGKHAHFVASAQDWIEDASLRGNAFARATYIVTGYGALRHLCGDQPQRSVEELEHVMRPWQSQTLGMQHFTQALGHHWALSYSDPEAALAFWRSAWPRLSSSLVVRAKFVSELVQAYRAEACLRAATARADNRELLSEAARLLKPLRTGQSPMATAHAALFYAQLSAMLGQRTEAISAARDAYDRYERSGEMRAQTAGLLITMLTDKGGAAAREQELLGWFESEGWRKPERALSLFLPAWSWLKQHGS
jgi:hypothetical protein